MAEHVGQFMRLYVSENLLAGSIATEGSLTDKSEKARVSMIQFEEHDKADSGGDSDTSVS